MKICQIVNGVPNAIIKDNDYTLNKGVSLFIKSQDKAVSVIEDISHVVANALKKQFEKTKSYKIFTKMLQDGAARLRQTEIAFLAPPKLRNKTRTMSL